MRIVLALVVALAACGGSKAKPEGALVKDEGSAVGDECCCKWTPITSEDARPLYEVGNRMECSTKQGTCVDEVQCNSDDSQLDNEVQGEPIGGSVDTMPE